MRPLIAARKNGVESGPRSKGKIAPDSRSRDYRHPLRGGQAPCAIGSCVSAKEHKAKDSHHRA